MKISEMITRGLHRAPVGVVLAVPSLIVGCDPGVTIRQADEVKKPSDLSLRVKSSHQLIGTTYYAPQVTVTNNSEATVVVTGIELATRQKIYAGSSPQPQDFPGEVSAKQARD